MAALLTLGLGLQLYFFRHYPQPYLFGDPAGYYNVGEKLQEAVSRLRAGDAASVVFADVRGLFYLLGVGALFAVLDGVRPQGFAFFRDVMAVFNTLAMLGAYLLGRRLSGSVAGGLVALVLAATYATFSVQTGRLYPDPVTAALFVFAAWAYAEAIQANSPRGMALAAVLLGAALLVRAQVLEYLTVVVALGLAGSAPSWARRPEGRRLVAAFVLGFLPTLAAWAGIRWAVGDRDDVVRMGQVTFRPTYPFGFWQQLDTDGWTGPYRFKQDPFYREMEAEAKAGHPDLLRSRRKQWAFTARYVARRARESALLVLDNAYRLYDRPANDYKWDYPFPYRVQVLAHRAIVVLGVAGMALVVAQRAALVGVFLVPLSLALLHGLVFPWPRYNIPGMPILIAAAGTLVGGLVAASSRPRGRALRLAVLAAAGGAAALLAGDRVLPFSPVTSRALGGIGSLALCGAPFLLVKTAVAGRRGTVAAAAGFGLLVVLGTGHAVRDRRWHEVATRLGDDVRAVEQDILLPPEALATLRRVPEAYVVFDLTVPRGDLQGATVRLGTAARAGAEVLPTMPRLREATATGGRDRRGYPQWWALRLDPAALPATAAEPLTVRLEVPAEADVVLRGDRFPDQARVYEGPSFGDWPRFVALKIEYDADYRIPVRQDLGSAGTQSRVVRGSGEVVDVPWVHRIRVLVPGSNEGWLAWETSPMPSAPRVAAAFAAYSGTRGEAELEVGGVPALRFPLGARSDFDVTGGPWRLCHRAEPPRQDRAYGAYVLVGPMPAAGAPLSLGARYRAGLSLEPMFFVIDRRRPAAELTAAAAACAPGLFVIDGAGRVLDGTRNNYPEDTGRWTVAAVY